MEAFTESWGYAFDWIDSGWAAYGVGLGLATVAGALVRCGISGMVLWLAALAAMIWVGPGYEEQSIVAVTAACVVVALVAGHFGERGRGWLALIASAAAGAATMYVWLPALADGVTWIELVAALDGGLAAIFGGAAAARIRDGATAGGGHGPTVAALLAGLALVAGAVTFVAPYLGYAVPIVAIVIVLRLRKRDEQRYAGLRILA